MSYRKMLQQCRDESQWMRHADAMSEAIRARRPHSYFDMALDMWIEESAT